MTVNGKLALPDALGDVGRARLGAEALLDLQAQRIRLDNAQTINGDSDDTAAPGLVADGKPITYAERRVQLADAAARLVEAYADIGDAFAKAVEQIRG